MKIAKQMALATILVAAFAGCGEKKAEDQAEKDSAKAAPEKEAPVKVELYVMSKCPYGVQAIDSFAPVMKTLEGAISLQIDFIGVEDDAGKLTTMHGETELAGDAVQLCAGAQAPDKQLDFIVCMNEKWREIPENWEECAKKVGLDAAALGECKDGEEGKKLLSASFKRSKDAGAHGSPTIKINGEDYKGGRMPNDFTRHICDTFGEKLKIKQCEEIPPPAKVKVTVITDKRCGPKCDPTPLFGSLSQVFAGLEKEVANWEDPETQALCEEMGITMLPAVVFDASLKNDTAGKAQIERWLVPKGDRFMLKVKPEFDPKAEICDNGQDDTGNGKVDCDDPGCAYSLACRPETKKKLELFIMSKCPYGMVAVKAAEELLEAFAADMTLQIHFIADELPDGKLESMHGPEEIAEDIRMLCAAKHYPKKNKYMDYIGCRGRDVRDNDWEKCTGDNGISAQVLKKCAEGEGPGLLEENIKIAAGLGIGASPTWIANGKHQFGGIVAHNIQQEYCKHNGGLEGCGKELTGAKDHHGHAHGDGHGPGPTMQRPEQPAPSCGD